jgi:GTPase SAR1 family protein
MANIIDQIITVIFGTISKVTQGISNFTSSLDDFMYVKVRGLSFVVLGSRQTGKTTLIEWLKRNMTDIDDFKPEPTTAGGNVVSDFTSKIESDEHIKLKPNRDVGGEYAMWETDWIELFRQAQPRGILFLVDHNNIHLHKDALNFVLQMIDDEPEARKHLKAFYILVNKSDLWSDETTAEEMLRYYKNEQKRLRAQAQRLGYKWVIAEGSLLTGEGVGDFIRKFFNTIRPKPRKPKSQPALPMMEG